MNRLCVVGEYRSRLCVVGDKVFSLHEGLAIK